MTTTVRDEAWITAEAWLVQACETDIQQGLTIKDNLFGVTQGTDGRFCRQQHQEVCNGDDGFIEPYGTAPSCCALDCWLIGKPIPRSYSELIENTLGKNQTWQRGFTVSFDNYPKNRDIVCSSSNEEFHAGLEAGREVARYAFGEVS